MDVIKFMDIEETDKDLIISFAIDIGDGDINTLLLHRTLFYETLLPEEERGTKVSLENEDLTEEEQFMNTLERVAFDGSVLRIKALFSDHEIDLRKLEIKEIEQIKDSLARHNFDGRFEVKFT